MVTVYVSGETMLRPVRMGLAITPGSEAELRRAVELAVGSWGGQGFPIIEVAGDHESALHLAVAMGVDCLFPVADEENLKELARTPGFEWAASWQGLSPFTRNVEGSLGEHILPASTLYDWYRIAQPPQPPVYYVSWPPDHELADLLMVWFGQFGDDVAGRADKVAFEAISQGCPVGTGLPLPPYPMSMPNQLTITMQDVIQQPRWQRSGIVVMESGNVSHLVSFWNLRASGQQVFPWMESHADLLEPPLSKWLEEMASATPPRPGQPPHLPLWLSPNIDVPPRLRALVGDGRFLPMPEAHRLDLRVCRPLMTSHVRRFTLDTGRGGEAVIPLPVLDFLPRRTSWTDLGIVAADIDVWQEVNDPVGETAVVVPAARCVARHMRSFVPFTRPRARGRVIPVRVSEETVSLMPISANYLARKLAADSGYKLSATENGRRVHHRIRLLGGIGSESLANQPAVREVVRQALRSPYGASAGSLVDRARSNEGGWSARFFGRRGFNDYAAQVVGTLAQLGILQPLACLTCPTCASTIRVPPSTLGEPIRCELCSALVSFSTNIANHPSRPATWAMKVLPALDAAHFNETIPVMGALSVIETACGKGFSGSGMLYVVGVELIKDAMQCEIDFMILVQDSELPAVIIGEAKAGHPDRPKPSDLLSDHDLIHLEAVQDSLRAIGIDCWICFSTTRPTLQQSEIDLLRQSCERSLTPVFDFRGLLLPALPIVLIGEDLSVPPLDARHPASRVRGFPRLPALSKDTCQRHLGMVDVDFMADASGAWSAKPRW